MPGGIDVAFEFDLPSKKRRREQEAQEAYLQQIAKENNIPAGEFLRLRQAIKDTGALPVNSQVATGRMAETQPEGPATASGALPARIMAPETRALGALPLYRSRPSGVFDKGSGSFTPRSDLPEGTIIQTDKDETTQPVYFVNRRSRKIFDLAGKEVTGPIPKNATFKDVEEEGAGKNFYFVDSATRQMFDANMAPIDKAPEGATPRILGNPLMGAEISKRDALSKNALEAVDDIHTVLNDKTLAELKAIRFTPGKIYAQLASSEAKKFYRTLASAIRKKTYIESGAAVSQGEAEDQMEQYWPASNDDMADMEDRLVMFTREVGNYMSPGSRPEPRPVPAPSKPKTVRQNGVTYTLNEATGEYE